MTTTAPTTKPSWLTGPFGASAAAAVVFLLLWQAAGMFSERIPGPAPVIQAAIREV
jgi:hypothetical protein